MADTREPDPNEEAPTEAAKRSVKGGNARQESAPAENEDTKPSGSSRTPTWVGLWMKREAESDKTVLALAEQNVKLAEQNAKLAESNAEKSVKLVERNLDLAEKSGRSWLTITVVLAIGLLALAGVGSALKVAGLLEFTANP
jgi:hypothetical protein